jgi:hypothetical protein
VISNSFIGILDSPRCCLSSPLWSAHTMDGVLPHIIEHIRHQVYPSKSFSVDSSTVWLESQINLIAPLMKTVVSKGTSRRDTRLALMGLYMIVKLGVACGISQNILRSLESVEDFWSAVVVVATGDSAEHGTTAPHYAIGLIIESFQLNQLVSVSSSLVWPRKSFSVEIFEAVSELVQSEQPASSTTRIEFDQILIDFFLLARVHRRDRLESMMKTHGSVGKFYVETFSQVRICRDRIDLLGFDPISATRLAQLDDEVFADLGQMSSYAFIGGN